MTGSTEVDSLAEALIEANDLLVGLYDLADVTSRSLDESQLVQDILERAIRIVRADELVLSTPTREVTVVGPNQRRRLEDSDSDPMTTTVTATHGFGLSGELQAVRSDSAFSTGDRKLLSAVLRTTLTAIETARLHTETVETALDAREHQRAAEVAQLALPQTRPQLDDVDIFFKTEQARETGGDLFCFHVDGDLLSFAVGDVSGKGLSAAVMMTTAVCATRAAFRDPRWQTPGEELHYVNDWMYDHLSDAGLFISMFIGHYRRGTDELSWANAGQSPCVVATENEARDLLPLTPPLGILPAIGDATEITELAHGDTVLIGSDGIVEQNTITGEAFGEARLHEALAAMRGESAAAMGAGLFDTVIAFAAGAKQSDDRTAVLLRHSSAART